MSSNFFCVSNSICFAITLFFDFLSTKIPTVYFFELNNISCLPFLSKLGVKSSKKTSMGKKSLSVFYFLLEDWFFWLWGFRWLCFLWRWRFGGQSRISFGGVGRRRGGCPEFGSDPQSLLARRGAQSLAVRWGVHSLLARRT